MQAIDNADTKEEEEIESSSSVLAIKNIHNDPGNTRLTNNFYPGNHEVEMCYEADLHKRVIGCKKNPDHKGFLPIKDFNINCLPLRYHNNDIMFETIKALAAITVMIVTKFTSLKRKFFAGTQVPYPCSNLRGTSKMRIGTGRVCGVDKYTESDRACRCAKCQVSATPSKMWGEVRVLTATHVVFDDSEARQTRCVLGFDDDNSPVTNLDGWEALGAPETESDLCWLSYETCDLELLEELSKKWQCYDSLCGETRYTYRRFLNEDKMTVIVSHPHGSPKQVSVGQWTHRYEMAAGRTRYVYTTSTCPGSSGASVYRLLCDGLYQHIHSKSNTEGNCSGVYGDSGPTSVNEYGD